MTARHNYDQRRDHALSVPRLGMTAVAEKARVTTGTVRDWCREFNIPPSHPALVSIAWPKLSLSGFAANLSGEEEIEEVSGNVRDAVHRALTDHETWDEREAFRQRYANFARHADAYDESGQHDAMYFFHARHMRNSVGALTASAPDPDLHEVFRLSGQALDACLEDLEHSTQRVEDDLPVPSYGALPGPVRYANFKEYRDLLLSHPSPLNELHGLAQFLAQEYIAAGESNEWRTHRDEFLKYCDARTDDTHHEAMELHWCRRMQQSFERMATTAHVGAGHDCYEWGSELLADLRSSDEFECLDFDWQGFDDFDDGLDQYFNNPGSAASNPCGVCDGTGRQAPEVDVDVRECPTCLGMGEVELVDGTTDECMRCDGTGECEVDEETVACHSCSGTGVVTPS